MPDIHPTAVISPSSKISPGVQIGAYSVIEEDVVIGEGNVIYNNVTILPGARLGKNNIVYPYAVISAVPQDLKFAGEYTELFIGDENIFREFTTISRGTAEKNKTVIGNKCLFMANSHAAHDCIIGNNCILANSVALGGHVEVEDYVTIGGLVGVHQFVKLGKHSMIGAHSMVVKDVPPFALFSGDPLKFEGLNFTGLRRRNFPDDTIEDLKNAYRILYNSAFNVSQAIQKIRTEITPGESVEHLLAFIDTSKRGITK